MIGIIVLFLSLAKALATGEVCSANYTSAKLFFYDFFPSIPPLFI